jgi:hypothetical protein
MCFVIQTTFFFFLDTMTHFFYNVSTPEEEYMAERLWTLFHSLKQTPTPTILSYFCEVEMTLILIAIIVYLLVFLK